MKRIVDAIGILRGLTANEQLAQVLGVVEERVGDSGSGRKRNEVARPEAVEVPVHPNVGGPFKHEHELLF